MKLDFNCLLSFDWKKNLKFKVINAYIITNYAYIEKHF